MNLAVISTDSMKKELLSQGLSGDIEVGWFSEFQGIEDVDAVIDLQFQPGADRLLALEKTGASTIIINHVPGTLKDLPDHYCRINGWPGFLSGALVEAAAKNADIKVKAEKWMSHFQKKLSWTPDQPGFVSARIVCMIINEAFMAVEEHVSSRDDIDTAMKLGTNYPFGPFEWTKLIGVSHVHELLVALSSSHERYRPSALLSKEALS